MQWWERVRRRIENANTAGYRTADGRVMTRTNVFRSMPLSMQKEINDIVENEQLIHTRMFYGSSLDTLSDAAKRSAEVVPQVLNVFNGSAPLAQRVADQIGYRDYMLGGGAGRGGLANNMWMSGMQGADPALANRVKPSLYISPSEAAALYSNEGLPKRIILKKAKSLLLNGVQIKNPLLSKEQLETVNRGMLRTGLPNAVSNALRDALVYGGSVLYPMFKQDTPLSMSLPVEQLIKYGLVKKNCLDYFVALDRWNTTHYPQWKPTAPDFLKPRYFYIPFLGCDVHSSRIARIVPSPQPGYWGVMMTMGWGVSDATGWIEAVFNYNNVMQAIPTMIQQMSIIARTFNIEGPMITEGSMVLEEMDAAETIRVREASPLNPISLDVVGKLEAIQRDFGEVPELTKLIRQDVAAKAGLLEQSLFTVEKKGMGGNANSKEQWTQEENTNRLMYSDVQLQLKPLAMIQIINDLGLDRDVLKALPYTTICFDRQNVTDVEDRVEIIKAATKGFFDLVAGGMDLVNAIEVVSSVSGGMMDIDSELRSALEERQARMDEMEMEKHNAEVEQMLNPPTPAGGEGGAPPKKKALTKGASGSPGKNVGHSYKGATKAQGAGKQHSMEKVAHSGVGTNKQGIQKARGKGG